MEIENRGIWFGSVIYKEAADYFGDFIRSLRSQSDRDFSIYLLNDNYSEEALAGLRAAEGIKLETADPAGGAAVPAGLRVELLRRMKAKDAGLLILGDCDDRFSPDRVQYLKKVYVEHPDAAFYYNEIHDFCGNPVMAELPERTEDFRTIGDYNFLGLSNTALNLAAMDMDFIDSLDAFEGDVFDWYLFSRLLLAGKYGVKSEGGATLYRIHASNTAGLPHSGKENTDKEIGVKRNHYYWLKKYDSYYEKKYDSYRREKEKIQIRDGSGRFWWDLTVSEIR